MSNEIQTEMKVKFLITGIKQLPELTDILEIEPSETWTLGSPIGNTLIKRKHNGWTICSSEKDIDLEKQILFLLNILIPKAELLNSIRQKYELEYTFACGIDIFDNSYPPLHLTKDTIKKISQIGAEIDIDII